MAKETKETFKYLRATVVLGHRGIGAHALRERQDPAFALSSRYQDRAAAAGKQRGLIYVAPRTGRTGEAPRPETSAAENGRGTTRPRQDTPAAGLLT